LLYDCSDPEVEGDPSAGVLRFVAYASDSASSVNLRCAYAPLYINHLRLHYRANYPACSVTLQSVLPGEIMSDWTMTTTNDGMGGTWLDLINPLAPLPMAALGDLLTFNMPGMTDVQTAFSFFTVDNSLYAGDQTFAVQNASSFITYYPIILHGSAPTSGHPFQMSIPTDVGRTYRVETATSLGSWSTLQDGIDGTGGLVTVTDTRNLSGVTSVFYRVAAY
jgi:hypothetical protein